LILDFFADPIVLDPLTVGWRLLIESGSELRDHSAVSS
jgi:hypothetical protein